MDFDYLCDVADNRKDTEPDDFFFNFAGLNGRFVFDQYGRIFHSSESNLRIEQVSNQQFEITAEDGTVYVFGKNRAGTETACETSTYPAQLGGTSCISSWYLTEILASDGTDRISFKYLSDNSQSVFHSGQTHHYPVGPTPYSQCNSEEWDYGTLHTIVIADSRRLREIAFTGGKLTFTSLKDRQDLGWGGYRLDEMKIENDLRYLRNFKFSYSYFNNGTSDAKRLQLKSVEEYDNSVRKPPHRFTYNESITYNGLSLPKICSKAQDHWGFYNGAFDNERLLHGIPAGQYNGVLLAGANREPGADFLAGVGMLEKIQYPSGGSTRFEFEAHDTGGGKGYRKVPQTQFVTTNIGGSALESSQTFTLSEGVLASVVFERPSPDFLRTHDFKCAPTFNLINVNTGEPVGVDSYNVVPTFAGDQNRIVVPNVGLQANIPYQIQVVSDSRCGATADPGLLSALNSSITVRYEVSTSEVISLAKKRIGGLRIKTITDYDGIDAANDVVRSYRYERAEDLSSGEVVDEPTYGYQYTINQNDPVSNPTNGMDCP
ncbi:MAG: hypothetical protein H7Z75_02155, partial [Ferruginibacter sp.]|nr:hypothetical protein [Cytophagales bacterium]